MIKAEQLTAYDGASKEVERAVQILEAINLVLEQHHDECARAARAAWALMMRDGARTLYVMFKPGTLEAFEEAPGPEWELAWPERVPSSLTVEQLTAWFVTRAMRVPYLKTDENKIDL